MSVKTLLRRYFVTAQSRRDVTSGDVWWKLPDDATRRSSAWRQLVVDLVAPATFSPWHAKVTKDRVALYDRLRLPVTRAVMLAVIVVALLWLGTPAWLMALTLWPAAAQVVLEIYLEPYALDVQARSRLSWVNLMTGIVQENHPNKLLNVTGVLGTVACPLNVAAVAFAPAGGDAGWVKVAALAAAIVYLNTGLANAFLDPPNYTENSTMPPFMHWVRPYAPLISLVVVTTLVALSVSRGHWDKVMIPVAYLCSLLTLQLGSTIRNHDRVLAAAVPTAREAITDGRLDMSDMTHTEMNKLKGPIFELQNIDAVPLALKGQLSAIPAIVTHLIARAPINASRKPLPLNDLARKILGEYDVTKYASVTYAVDWSDVDDRHQAIAEKVMAALCLNAAQALSKAEFHGRSADLVIEAFRSGSGRDIEYTVAVHDHLPEIPNFCEPGRSLTSLRAVLRNQYAGDLRQAESAYGTKAIVATWSDRTPEVKVGEVFELEEL